MRLVLTQPYRLFPAGTTYHAGEAEAQLLLARGAAVRADSPEGKALLKPPANKRLPGPREGGPAETK